MSLQDMLVGAVKNHFQHDDDDDDLKGAVSHASHNDSTSDTSLFQSAMSFVKERKSNYRDEDDDIDEGKMVSSHQALYGSGGSSDSSFDSKSLGAGAAMQALKMFNSSSSQESGAGDKNKFIGLAMAQAGKLWEEKQSNGQASGDKQSAVNAAAETAFKMYLKSQMSGSSGTGGPSGLLSLASKFM